MHINLFTHHSTVPTIYQKIDKEREEEKKLLFIHASIYSQVTIEYDKRIKNIYIHYIYILFYTLKQITNNKKK